MLEGLFQFHGDPYPAQRLAWVNRMFNRLLDSCARVEVFQVSAFHLWVISAFALAILLSITLAVYFQLSPVVMMLIDAAALMTIMVRAMAGKIVTGEEQHVAYQHVLLIAAVTASLLWLMGQPILPYLDIIFVGINVVFVVGRIGCFMVACCHGRPARWGVCYRQEHADAGFVSCYVGVRLLPVQLVESLMASIILAIGSALVLSAQRPGAFLAWFSVCYGVGRFALEFLRSDPERPYLWGFSEAQWTSLVLVCLIASAEVFGVLQFHTWHFMATAVLMLGMIVIAGKRNFHDRLTRQLFEPRHLREVAEVMKAITEKPREVAPVAKWSITAPPRVPQEIRMARTSLGVQLSNSTCRKATDLIDHYSFSKFDGSMTEETAKRLARLIVRLRSPQGPTEFVSGKSGVFHLLIHSEGNGEVAYS